MAGVQIEPSTAYSRARTDPAARSSPRPGGPTAKAEKRRTTQRRAGNLSLTFLLLFAAFASLLAFAPGAEAAITLRAASSGDNGGGGVTLTISKPTGTVQYDVMVAQITVLGGTGTTITPPLGWTLINRTNSGTTLAQAVYWKAAALVEGTSYIWTITNNKASGGIIAYTGVDNAGPIDASGAQANAAGTTVTAPSITTNVANTQLVGFFGTAAGDNSAVFTAPSGMTERFDITGGNGRTASEGADEAQAAAGSTGTRAATATLSAVNIGHLIALRQPSVAFSSAASSAAESTTAVSLPVTLSGASGSTVTVNWAITGGTAAAADYSGSTSGTLTFTAGNTSQNVALTIVNDALDEDNETIQLTLSSPTNANLGANTVHTYTINDNDAQPSVQFSAASSSGAESSTPAQLNVSLSAASGRTVTVNYAATGGNATGGGVDYTLASGSLSFSAGQTSKQINITIVDDSSDEFDESVIVTLSSPSNADLGAQTTHTRTITDNDAPPTVQFSSASSSGSESSTPAQLSVGLSAASGKTVSVNYAVSGGNASGSGVDYTLASGSLTFNPGQTSKTVDITIVNDAINEPDETIIVSLSSPSNASLGAQTSHTYTITDNDAVPTVQFSAASSSGSESSSTAQLNVTLSAASGQTVTVHYAASGGNATGGGTDYTLASGNLSFSPGQTSKTINITIAEDSLDEPDESIVVSLSSPVHATLGSPSSHTHTILDNDAAPSVAFSSASSSGAESSTPAQLTVTLSAASGKPVTVNYAVTGGTASGSGVDYTLASGSLTFNPGQTSKTIDIAIVDDAVDENAETIQVTLSSPANASLGAQTTHTYTINDNDGPTASVTATDALAGEPGADTGTFMISRTTGDLLTTLTVHYTVSGTASNGTDYVALLGTAIILPTKTSVNVTLVPIDDLTSENNETAILTISADAAYNVGAPSSATVTIVDNDPPVVTINASDASASEAGPDAGTFTFTRQGNTASAITIHYAVSGNATNGTDYAALSGSIVIAAGNTSANLTLSPLDDALAEISEDVILTLSLDLAYTMGSPSSATIFIADNEVPNFTIVESGGNTIVSESGGFDTFTIALLVQPVGAVVIALLSGDLGEATASPSSLTFGPGNWSVAQTATVTGVNDQFDDGDQATTITASIVDAASHDAWDAVANQSVSATTTDDDAAGITLVESGGATIVAEPAGTDSFTVALESEPITDVVLSVTSGDPGEATVSPGQLIFGPGNWSVPQTVNVNAADDELADANETTLITISVVDASSSDEYDGLANETVSATTTDDDVAGFTIVQSGNLTLVSEPAGTDNFTVVLDAEPASAVVLLLTNNDPSAVSLSAPSLTFGPGNWSVPQLVTVTAVNDAVDDGDQPSNINVSIDAAASSDEFDAVESQLVAYVAADDDEAGFVIDESGGETQVSESGSGDTFTVVLTSEPASDVVLTLTSDDPGEAAVSPSTLTFGASNWTVPQTVTVTGVNDDLADGNQGANITVSIDDAASSNEYDAIEDQNVTASIEDNDVAGYVIVESGGETEVSEAGATDSFTVVLTAEPTSDVVLSVASGDLGEASVSVGTLTFGPGNWSVAQAVNVTGVDDDLDDGDQVFNIALSIVDADSADEYDDVASDAVSTTNLDDDTAGFLVTESGGETQVSESGSSDNFTVVLTAEPTSDVAIAIANGDPSEATASPALLVFGPGNWSLPQEVTVSGLDDDLDDGNQTANLTLSIDPDASAAEFDAVGDQWVLALNVDDDAAGLTIQESDGETVVAEPSGSDTFTVALEAQPASTVVVSVASGDLGEATVSPGLLIFGPGNWSVPQTVTVTAADDLLADGNQSTLITVSIVDASSSDEFDGVPDETVSATTTDDDVAGFAIVQSDDFTIVDEPAGTDNFTVVLDAEPASDVVLLLENNDPSAVSLSAASLAFGPGNWSVPQLVTVTAVNDDLADGDQPSNINVSIDAAASSDEYDAVEFQLVAYVATDDDVAGFLIAESGGSTDVSESGSSDNFTVVLTAEPASDVVLLISSDDTDEALASPASLTFGPSNWTLPQTVTVTGVDDEVSDGDQLTLITVSVDDASSSNEFDDLDDQSVAATTQDDDVADFLIDESGGLSEVSESGSSDNFTVVLTAEPTSDVVLAVSSGDESEATVSPILLTFGPGNWSVPQEVTITGTDDDLDDGDQAFDVLVEILPDESADEYDAVPSQTVSITTFDDDAAGFEISESDNSTQVSESGSSDNFTVVLTAEPTSDVVLLLSGSLPQEAGIAPAMLVFGPANWSEPQDVTVTGLDDDLDDGDQTSNITISIDAAGSADEFDAVPDQYVLASVADDDAAGFTVVESDGETIVAEPSGADDFTVVLDAEPASDVVILVASNDAGAATVSPEVLVFGPGNWSIPQVVNVDAVDDDVADGNQSSTITLSIDDANSSDEFDDLDDQGVPFTTLDDDVAGFLIEESDDSTEVSETGSNDTFTVVLTSEPGSDVVLLIGSNDTDESSVAPATLTFGPGNWSSPQTVTVTGVDDALIDGAQSSLVTVSVDDASSSNEYDDVADQTVDVTTADNDTPGFEIVESFGLTQVSESGSNDTFTVVLLAGPSSDVVLSIGSDDLSEADASPATLTFGPGNWSVPQTVTVTGLDDDLADGSQLLLVTVSILADASADEYDNVTEQSVLVENDDNDAAGFTISESDDTVVGEPAGTDSFDVVLDAEPASDVVLLISSGDEGEATVSPAILVFGPGNWSVPQEVTVTAADDFLVDGNQSTTILVSIDQGNTSDEFDEVADGLVFVTTTDDDVAGFTITPSGNETVVSEPAGTDSISIVLTAEPASDVVLGIFSDDLSESDVSPMLLVFGPGNWSVQQNVTVLADDDSIIDGNQTSNIMVFVIDGDSSDEFDDVADQSIQATTLDDDVAGLLIDESSGSTVVSESGTTDSFTVALAAEPDSDVVLLITSGDEGEATVSPTSLTFGPGNWSVPQTVDVTGVDDPNADGPQFTNIRVLVDDANSDDNFDGLSEEVSATTQDDDTPAVFITESGGSTLVNETGTNDTFEVVLSAEPFGDVVLDISSADTGEATVAPMVLVFGPGNWSVPQNVTVLGIDDLVDDNDTEASITIAVNASLSSDEYDAVESQSFNATNGDNDGATPEFQQTLPPLTGGLDVQIIVGASPSNSTSTFLNVTIVPTNSTIGPVLFTATILTSLPSGTPPIPGLKAGSLGEIWNMTLEEGNVTVDIDNATVAFFIGADWLASHCAPPTCAIRLFHFNEATGKWETLVPTPGSSDADGTFYDATVFSFSPFAIGGVSVGGGGGGGGGGGAPTPTPSGPVVPPTSAPNPTPEGPGEPGEPEQPPEVPAPPAFINVPQPTFFASWGWYLLIGVGIAFTLGGIAAFRYHLPQRGWHAGVHATRNVWLSLRGVPLSARSGLDAAAAGSLAVAQGVRAGAEGLTLNVVLAQIIHARRRSLVAGTRASEKELEQVAELSALLERMRRETQSKRLRGTVDLSIEPRPDAEAMTQQLSLADAYKVNRLLQRLNDARRRQPHDSWRARKLALAEVDALILKLAEPNASAPHQMGADPLDEASMGDLEAAAEQEALKMNRILGQLRESRKAGEPSLALRERALTEARALDRIFSKLHQRRAADVLHGGSKAPASPAPTDGEPSGRGRDGEQSGPRGPSKRPHGRRGRSPEDAKRGGE